MRANSLQWMSCNSAVWDMKFGEAGMIDIDKPW